MPFQACHVALGSHGGLPRPLRACAHTLLSRLAIFLLPCLLLSATLARSEDDPAAKAQPQQADDDRRDADEGRPAGLLVPISVPITSSSELEAERAIDHAVQRLKREASPEGPDPILILEFVPRAGTGAGTRFTRAYDLANYISELKNIRTIAYVPRSLSGHAVLAVMACEHVFMAPDASIGRAGTDEDSNSPIDELITSGYRIMAEKRRTFPVAVALGMLDKNYEVLVVSTEDGEEIILRRDLESLLENTSVESRRVIVPRGEVGWFSGTEARNLGFVRFKPATRKDVADRLELPESALTPGFDYSGELNPRVLTVKGYINSKMSDTRRRMIENCLREDVNYIGFWIDSGDGDVDAAIELASAISQLDSTEVRTVAYVPYEAQGAGAIVAVACDDIVMGPKAKLGMGDAEWTPEQVSDVATFVRGQLAVSKKSSWSLLAALFDPSLRVNAYRHKENNRRAYFSQEELDAELNAGDWKLDQRLTAEGETLTVEGSQAAELGLASDTVKEFSEFKALENLADDVTMVEPGWAEDLVDILTTPQVAALLLLIGLVGMYAEVQLPGVGIGGFIATVAFVLFFWANYMEQTANTLEILLFLVGVSCLVLEVFVIPGFGIFGLGGGVMIITSLVLASQTFVLPGTPAEITQLRDSLLVVGSSGVAFVGLAMLMRRYLPHTPLFRHVLLEPPGADHPESLDQRESMADFRHLVGQRGTAATQLTPAGKARFGDELVDVVSDGDLIEKGESVSVAEVHGNRVVVTSVKE